MLDDKNLDREYSDSTDDELTTAQGSPLTVHTQVTGPDYGFQLGLQDKAFEHLIGPSKTVVLAAAPGAGKTEMAIELIRRFVAQHPGSRVLVLTHGQTVLRDNFRERLKTVPRDFTWEVLTGDTVPTTRVHLALPHHFRGREVPCRYDLVVVDEAHHFFFAKLIQKVLHACPNRHLLLLTGTPSPFVRANRHELGSFPLVSMTATELLGHGVLTDPRIELVQTGKKVGLSDYSNDDNLRKTVSFSDDETGAALRAGLERLSDISATPDEARTLDLSRIKKTMVVCHNRQQARHAHAFFAAKGIGAAVSVSEDDKDSSEIKRFTNDEAIKVLVVVNRATLGFNYPPLASVIDISLTHNPDRLFQSLCRVVRRNGADEKVFIKVTTQALFEATHVVMSFAVALSLPDYFNTYDGQWKTTAVPVFRLSEGQETETAGKAPVRRGPALDEIELPRLLSFGEIQRAHGASSDSYSFTTFDAVRERLTGRALPRSWTKEELVADARRFQTRAGWRHGSSGSSVANRKFGKKFFEECCAHMAPVNRSWSDEDLIADARRFETRGKWKNGSSSAYSTALKRGNEFFAACCSHMKTQQRSWSDDELRADALRFSTRGQWAAQSPSAYQLAKRRNPEFFDECCAHMTKRQSWTDEKLKADALRFLTRTEWKGSSASGYATAVARGSDFYEECCAHMTPLLRGRPSRRDPLGRGKKGTL